MPTGVSGAVTSGPALEYHRTPRPLTLPRAPRPLEILLLYSRSPLPMTRGDQQHVAQWIEFLHARGHIVDFIYLIPRGSDRWPEHGAWLRSRCREVKVVELGRLERALQALLGLARGLPVQVGLFASGEQRRLAVEWCHRRRYDIAYAAYLRATEPLLAVAPFVPLSVLALGLSQTLNTAHLRRRAPTLAERLFFRLEHQLVARYEPRICRRVARVVFGSPEDRRAVETAGGQRARPPLRNLSVVPHGVDVGRLCPRPSPGTPGVVMMTGVMRYLPNVDAALWMVRDVWPAVVDACPEARLLLVGRDPAPAVQALHGRRGVTVTGTVDSVADWLARARVCVAPVRAASGQQNKVLEAMAMGKPLVATPAAVAAFGLTPERDALVAADAQAFAAAVVRLLRDPGLAARVGTAARRFVEDGYSWEALFLRHEAELYADLAGMAPAVPPPVRSDHARPASDTAAPKLSATSG